jgi:hypothetical protein
MRKHDSSGDQAISLDEFKKMIMEDTEWVLFKWQSGSHFEERHSYKQSNKQDCQRMIETALQ